MSLEHPGRTAPWAKALGAVLLALLTMLTVSYVISRSEEADRRSNAFQDTREDARRFAHAFTSQDFAPSLERRAIQDVLNTSVGKGGGLLFAVEPVNGGTRVIVQFSKPYRRAVHLFGPSDAAVRRCFTIVLSPDRRPQISAHGADESCRDVARS